jgi:hypothetical protein
LISFSSIKSKSVLISSLNIVVHQSFLHFLDLKLHLIHIYFFTFWSFLINQIKICFNFSFHHPSSIFLAFSRPHVVSI